MTGTSTVELAPAAVMRAAAWPLSALDGFGDLGPGRTQLSERTYRSILQQERDWLWSHTLGDPLFEKALALSSPSAMARGRSAAARRNGVRNRAMRGVEQTLYRYLARAAGRTTPYGLWAGVTEVSFGEHSFVETRPAHARFTPNLVSFQLILGELARREQYFKRARWTLNPSLHPVPEGGWVFLTRCARGHPEWRTLGADPGVARALSCLAQSPPDPFGDLVSKVAASFDWSPTAKAHLPKMLRALAEGGVLVGGLDLPNRFETPWASLERASQDLIGEDRSAWKDAVERLVDQCEVLSECVWASPVDAFVAKLDKARSTIAKLAVALGVDIGQPAPRSMRCDLRLPWRVSLGKHRLPFLRDALDDYDCCWLRGVSPATELRAIERERLRISIGQGIPLGEAARRVPGLVALPVSNWPYPEQVSEPGLRNRLRAWQACLDQHDTEAVLVPPEQPGNAPRSPIGSLFVALSDDSRLEIRAVSDRPTLATGRFYGLLDDQGIHAWARTKLDEWARRDGLSLVELSAPFKPNPNVLAARPLVNRFVAPQNASTGAVSLQSARVRAHPKTGQPVIECSGHSGSYVVLAPGSANLQAGDPLTRLLLMTGFHESPTRDQRAVDVPTAHEFAEPRHMPRVRLPHGALMRERRTLLTRDLTGLLRASGAERFSAWQRLARKFDWARRLRVSVAGGEPMTVNRDSPLGVEALLKGVNPKTPFVAVEDAGDCGRVSVSGQDTFLAEMVLPFARQAR